MAKYEVTGRVVGVKKGAVVEFSGDLPRAYKGRVRALPTDLTPKASNKPQGEAKK